MRTQKARLRGVLQSNIVLRRRRCRAKSAAHEPEINQRSCIFPRQLHLKICTRTVRMAKDKDDAKAKDDDKKKVAEKADGHAQGDGDAAAVNPKGRFAFLTFSRTTLTLIR